MSVPNSSFEINECRGGRSARRGITLLELLLVLSLLVLIGAMAYPTFRKPFQMQTLRKGGEVVRVEWGKARYKAMKTGQIQMFTFQPETGTFTVQPYFNEQSMLEGDLTMTGGAAMGGTAAMMSANQTESDAVIAQPRELPEGVVFVSFEMDIDERDLLIQQELQGSIGGMTNVQQTDSQNPPVLFYPDGTTSDAKVVLTNEYQEAYVVVSLRSLTGIVKVSDLVSLDEIQTVP